MEELNVDFTIACPSFPDAGRTVFYGHMFVNGKPLNESGMEKHPLTPMIDNNLVRWLDYQTKNNVGLIDYETINNGSQSVKDKINKFIDDILKPSSGLNSDKKLLELSFQAPLKEAREYFEKEYLVNQLKKHHGNISKTADFIGMERSALHRKLKSLGIKGIN